MRKFDKYVKCFQGVINQDILLFVPDDLNAVCKADLQQRKAEIDIFLDEENILLSGLFFSVVLSGDLLFLIPGKSEQVIIYNMKMRELKRIDICEPKIKTNEMYNRYNKFYGGFVRNNNVYILAATYPAILKINIDTEETEYIDDWIEEIKDRIPEGDTNCYFLDTFILDGRYAYIPGSVSKTIVRLDCDTDKTHVFKAHAAIKIIHGLIKHKEEMWVLSTTDGGTSLIKWFPEKGFQDEIVIDSNLSDDIYWWNPVEVDGLVYLFQSSGVLYQVDIQEQKAAVCLGITEAMGGFPKANSKYMVRLIGVYNKKILFLHAWTGKWYEYDTVNQQIDSFVLEIMDDDICDECDKKYWNAKNQLEGNALYANEWNYPLTKYLNMINETNSFERDAKLKEGEVARKIYERCCKISN